MKKFKIKPSTLSGSINASPSKSHSLRAILFATMARGKSVIRHYLHSPDVDAMIEACRQLGATITQKQDYLEIEGVSGKPKTPKKIIDAGNSGQVLRFVGAIASLTDGEFHITGDQSVRTNRPVTPLIEGLSHLGVQCSSTSPLTLCGPMRSGVTTLDGTDSQPVSALLIAAAFVDGVTEINVTNPGEKPWVGLTLSWFDRLGIRYENQNFEKYRVFGRADIAGFEYTVPGDFSSLAYPITAALVTQSEVTINNVDMNDAQGDKKIIDALINMGANIEIVDHHITIKPSNELRGCEIDVNDFIDAVTILAVIGCYASGTTVLSNAYIARKKESDRLATITAELTKMGAQIQETDDSLIITNANLSGTQTFSHHDHRIAMSLAVAGMGANKETIIDDIKCVAKSYPGFVADMQHLGCNIEVLS